MNPALINVTNSLGRQQSSPSGRVVVDRTSESLLNGAGKILGAAEQKYNEHKAIQIEYEKVELENAWEAAATNATKEKRHITEDDVVSDSIQQPYNKLRKLIGEDKMVLVEQNYRGRQKVFNEAIDEERVLVQKETVRGTYLQGLNQVKNSGGDFYAAQAFIANMPEAIFTPEQKERIETQEFTGFFNQAAADGNVDAMKEFQNHEIAKSGRVFISPDKVASAVILGDKFVNDVIDSKLTTAILSSEIESKRAYDDIMGELTAKGTVKSFGLTGDYSKDKEVIKDYYADNVLSHQLGSSNNSSPKDAMQIADLILSSKNVETRNPELYKHAQTLKTQYSSDFSKMGAEKMNKSFNEMAKLAMFNLEQNQYPFLSKADLIKRIEENPSMKMIAKYNPALMAAQMEKLEGDITETTSLLKRYAGVEVLTPSQKEELTKTIKDKNGNNVEVGVLKEARSLGLINADYFKLLESLGEPKIKGAKTMVNSDRLGLYLDEVITKDNIDKEAAAGLKKATLYLADRYYSTISVENTKELDVQIIDFSENGGMLKEKADTFYYYASKLSQKDIEALLDAESSKRKDRVIKEFFMSNPTETQAKNQKAKEESMKKEAIERAERVEEGYKAIGEYNIG